MSTERERAIGARITLAGVVPVEVGIGRYDDVPWAIIRVGANLKRFIGSGESDDEAADDIVRQVMALNA